MRWRRGGSRQARQHRGSPVYVFNPLRLGDPQARTQEERDEELRAAMSPYAAGLTDDMNMTWERYLREEFGVESDAPASVGAAQPDRAAEAGPNGLTRGLRPYTQNPEIGPDSPIRRAAAEQRQAAYGVPFDAEPGANTGDGRPPDPAAPEGGKTPGNARHPASPPASTGSWLDQCDVDEADLAARNRNLALLEPERHQVPPSVEGDFMGIPPENMTREQRATWNRAEHAATAAGLLLEDLDPDARRGLLDQAAAAAADPGPWQAKLSKLRATYGPNPQIRRRPSRRPAGEPAADREAGQ